MQAQLGDLHLYQHPQLEVLHLFQHRQQLVLVICWSAQLRLLWIQVNKIKIKVVLIKELFVYVKKNNIYRLHSFLLTDAITYGHFLNDILSDNDRMRSDAVKRPSNSRKPDPLCALSDHQHFKRVTKEVYFRNICGLACGHRRIENNLDQVMSHGTSIKKPGNIANPINFYRIRY